MKKWIVLMLFAALLLPTLGLAEAFDKEAEAKALVEQIMADDVDAYYDKLSPEIQQQLPRESLETTGEQLIAQAGEFLGFRDGVQAFGSTVSLPLEMAGVNLIAQVAFDADGTIIGFGFIPDTAGEPDTTVAENEEEVGVGPNELAGLLTMPEETDDKVPAVVLVHGSGPNDRNERLGETVIFKDIAHGLAEQGIAVLRYDKRTYEMQQGTLPYAAEDLENMTVYDETIEDAVAAVALLREDERIDPERVFIIGHSQGALLATRMQQEGADANGLILLAGTLRHLTDLLADQLAAMDAGIDVYTEEIELARTLPEMTEEEAREHTLIGSPAFSFWEEAQHDLTEAAEENEAPMLILQGTEDQNVYADVDFVLWEEFAEAHPEKDITLKLYEGLGHAFVDGTSFSAEVLDDIAAWILEK